MNEWLDENEREVIREKKEREETGESEYGEEPRRGKESNKVLIEACCETDSNLSKVAKVKGWRIVSVTQDRDRGHIPKKDSEEAAPRS